MPHKQAIPFHFRPCRPILFNMCGIPYSISVVLDPEFGAQVRELLEAGPVWVTDSPTNRDAAQKIWAESPKRNHLDGVTVFKSATGNPAQMLTDQMENIDRHHGVYSAEPAFTVMRVIGCELEHRVQATLAEFGFNVFHGGNGGFEAIRPLPAPLGV